MADEMWEKLNETARQDNQLIEGSALKSKRSESII